MHLSNFSAFWLVGIYQNFVKYSPVAAAALKFWGFIYLIKLSEINASRNVLHLKTIRSEKLFVNINFCMSSGFMLVCSKKLFHPHKFLYSRISWGFRISLLLPSSCPKAKSFTKYHQASILSLYQRLLVGSDWVKFCRNYFK